MNILEDTFFRMFQPLYNSPESRTATVTDLSRYGIYVSEHIIRKYLYNINVRVPKRFNNE